MNGSNLSSCVRQASHSRTRAQRAQSAKNNQNADGKLDKVLQTLIHSQKAAAAVRADGPATVSTTFVRIYNATGDPITYTSSCEWEGHISGGFPSILVIQNGQWAIIEHVGTRGPNREGSAAAVAFNIQETTDAMIAWNNPWKTTRSTNNSAYCEMNYPGYFDGCDWDAIYEKLKASGIESQASMEGFATKVTIDAGGNTPTVTSIYYLDIWIT